MVPSDIIKDPSNNPCAASYPQAADGGDPNTILLLGRIVSENSQKRCALCQDSIPNSVEPCTFPSTAPAALAALNPHLGSEAYSSGPKVFCHKCWVWIYNLSICWTCGETVGRGEEKVSYGWCWWHWACVSCMICRSPIPPPPWTNDPRGIALRKLPLCRYCVDDLSFLKIEIVQDTLPPIMPLPEPALPSQPEFSESCRRRRPTPKWMDKLPSNRVSKQSAPRIPEPLTPQILEPSAPPYILKQPPPPPPRVSKETSTPTASSPSSSPPCTTILVPPDSKTSPSSSATTTNATVVIAELRTPIRSSSIHKTFATAAALARTSARRRRRYDSLSSPYVIKELSALFSAVGEGGGGGAG